MSTENDLHIPDEVIAAWCQGADVDWDMAHADLALIAAPVVAAELRRLADVLAGRAAAVDDGQRDITIGRGQGLTDAAATLRARADQLDATLT